LKETVISLAVGVFWLPLTLLILENTIQIQNSNLFDKLIQEFHKESTKKNLDLQKNSKLVCWSNFDPSYLRNWLKPANTKADGVLYK
jgi:hypothetical protein